MCQPTTVFIVLLEASLSVCHNPVKRVPLTFHKLFPSSCPKSGHAGEKRYLTWEMRPQLRNITEIKVKEKSVTLENTCVIAEFLIEGWRKKRIRAAAHHLAILKTMLAEENGRVLLNCFYSLWKLFEGAQVGTGNPEEDMLRPQLPGGPSRWEPAVTMLWAPHLGLSWLRAYPRMLSQQWCSRQLSSKLDSRYV